MSGPTVIKLGGTLLDDIETIDVVWRQIGGLRRHGHDVIVVHGGGSQASALAARLGHRPRIIHGRRVTTDLDLEIALWAFRGALNAELVAAGRRAGVPAAGLSGADGATLNVHRRLPREIDGELVDFGWVGDVDGVDTTLLRTLLGGRFVPVVAPIGIGADGALFNVNADTVAVSIATAIEADCLLFVSASGGLRRDQHDPATRVPECNADLVAHGVSEGWITEGMKVKVETALDAAQRVPLVRIVAPETLTDDEAGTRIVSRSPSSRQSR